VSTLCKLPPQKWLLFGLWYVTLIKKITQKKNHFILE